MQECRYVNAGVAQILKRAILKAMSSRLSWTVESFKDHGKTTNYRGQ